MSSDQSIQNLDGAQLRDMVHGSLYWLKAHREVVNALNVFPVPDGDTGTNMLLTMDAAWEAVQKIEGVDLYDIAHAVAQGALMGSKGNSGVILSQWWLGFANALKDHTSINTATFANAMRTACEKAYESVADPVEGTILSVSRAIADAAEASAQSSDDFLKIFDQVIDAASEAVARTPTQLDILRQAGVVDSGGKGLLVILEGMLRQLRGMPVDVEPMPVEQSFDPTVSLEELIEPGQDFELVFDLRPNPDLNMEQMTRKLSEYGTSIQIGGGDDVLKIHIHVPTDNFYTTQEYAFTLGTIKKIAVENLQDQLAELRASADRPRGQYQNLGEDDIATIAVAPSDGLAKVFESLDTSWIISGGQTMNPSTEDFIKAMEMLPSKRVLLIPNNSNILMAARQAAQLVKDKEVIVVGTRTIPQGVAAMVAFNPQSDLEVNAHTMEDATKHVRTGEVTYATRTVEIDGLKVLEGQAICLFDDKLSTCGETLEDAIWQLLKQMQTADGELLTLYFGDSVTLEDANTLAESIGERYDNLDIEIIFGGQPHYPYLLSVE